jgi:type VI secretion system secreted protein VgrG
LRRLQDQLAQYSLPLEVRTWEVPYRATDKEHRANMKYVYAAVSSQREVRSDLSLIYYRIMRELAVENGVPFGEIDEGEPRLSLPAELMPISKKLRMLRSTCRAAAASRNLLDTQRYLLKIGRCIVY